MIRGKYNVVLIIALLLGSVSLPLHDLLFHSHDHGEAAHQCNHAGLSTEEEAPHNHAGDTSSDPCSLCARCVNHNTAALAGPADSLDLHRPASIAPSLTEAFQTAALSICSARAPPEAPSV